jgi:hypothetical protein
MPSESRGTNAVIGKMIAMVTMVTPSETVIGSRNLL